MMRNILLSLASVVFIGCSVNTHQLDINMETKIITTDFIGYIQSICTKSTWIKIDGNEKNKYILELRSMAAKNGFKVCTKECPNNTIKFKIFMEKINENLLETTLNTQTTIFHRLYRIDKQKNIRPFGNTTIYMRGK